MNRLGSFLNLLACSVLVCSVILVVVVLLLSTSCSSPELETPVLRHVFISAPDSMEIKIDGILQGYGPKLNVILVENLPNFLEIGPWEFVLFPVCDYDSLSVR